MTYRELINQVLIRLREDTISSDWSGAVNDSSTVSAYHKVIGSLVNSSSSTMCILSGYFFLKLSIIFK